MSEKACAVVILAAGASTRLGQAKQLVSIDGEALLLRTAHGVREGLARAATIENVIARAVDDSANPAN